MNSSDFSASLIRAQANVPSQNVNDLAGLQSLKTVDDKDEALKQVAKQFESLFVNMMMKSMRDANAVFEKDSLFNSEDSKMFRDMYDQQMSVNLTQGQGLGIAEVLYRQLSYQGRSAPVSEDSSAGLEFNRDQRSKSLDTGYSVTTQAALNEFSNPASASNDEVAAQGERRSLTESVQSFINLVSPYVKQAAQKIGVDPNVLVAQAALETGWGKHVIADNQGESSFNLFNIKANNDWQGEKVAINSVEYDNNVLTREVSEFKKYPSLSESFNDYTSLITTQPRYQDALENASNPKAYIDNIHQAGYATDPQYSEKVFDIYQRLNNAGATANRGDA